MLMTSLAVPVLGDGKFAGITGVDMNLPIFQQLAEHLGRASYDNQAEVTLVSRRASSSAATAIRTNWGVP